MTAAPGKVDASRFPEVVHYLDSRRTCRVAIPAGVHGEGDSRDLTVIAAGGAERRPFVQYDGGPDPEPGTWHRSDYCPETRIRLGAEDRLTDDQRDLLTQLTGDDGGSREPFGVVRSLFPDLPGRTVTLGNAESMSASPVLSYLVRTVTSTDPVWVVNPRTGAAEAVIIPAADWHEPGTCCCSNCPWQGNHGTEKRHGQ